MINTAETVQTFANLATVLGLIVALVIFSCEIKSTRNEREYQSFLTLQENYQQIVEGRKNQWKKVKDVVKGNPKTAQEIPDKQNSLSYLLLRMEQTEPMYAIEHSLLASELKSLNFLDKLCEIALQNDRALQILFLTDSHEISYYQSRLGDLLKLYESQKSLLKFSKPRYNSLLKCDISDFFG
ncbi:MAG: hypothetical protein KAR42_05015 [candidate division Zixibacteria bacterium]|nr:hypothetical protein [candidate division Zixibacteria bacterium]